MYFPGLDQLKYFPLGAAGKSDERVPRSHRSDSTAERTIIRPYQFTLLDDYRFLDLECDPGFLFH